MVHHITPCGQIVKLNIHVTSCFTCLHTSKENQAAKAAVEASSGSTGPPVFNMSLSNEFTNMFCAPQPPAPALQAIPAHTALP